MRAAGRLARSAPLLFRSTALPHGHRLDLAQPHRQIAQELAHALARVRRDHPRGPAFDIAESAGVDLCACGSPALDADEPVIRLENVDGAFIHACRASAETKLFLQLEGGQTREIVLSGNALAAGAVQTGASVPPDAVRFTL